ncbi:MAG: hypothetical protein KGJ80_08760 [Chloroflexota bacterium]|nr:hypothetical protein [Chloroflexota bacterium]
MPVYEYECENCGTRFERLQSMKEESVRVCPECAGRVHKIFHAAGIIFKGSGWYITDSRKATSGAVSSNTKPSGAESKPTETKPATKTETKTETKIENKTENK